MPGLWEIPFLFPLGACFPGPVLPVFSNKLSSIPAGVGRDRTCQCRGRQLSASRVLTFLIWSSFSLVK